MNAALAVVLMVSAALQLLAAICLHRALGALQRAWMAIQQLIALLEEER